MGSVVGGMLYHYGEHSWRFRLQSSDNIETSGLHNVTRGQVMDVMGGDIGRNIFLSLSPSVRRNSNWSRGWNRPASCASCLTGCRLKSTNAPRLPSPASAPRFFWWMRPENFGLSVPAFHKANAQRAERWPNTMLGTSSHDTKHGEDFRARLAVLSEMPEEWARQAQAWSRLLRARRGDVEGTAPPDRRDEYLFYQLLLGAWPAELTDAAPTRTLSVASPPACRVL